MAFATDRGLNGKGSEEIEQGSSQAQGGEAQEGAGVAVQFRAGALKAMPEEGPERRRRKPRILGLSQRRQRLMAAPEDSATGCRERAEADLRRANEDMPINARQVLQASATHWLARAELLDRLETSFATQCVDGPKAD